MLWAVCLTLLVAAGTVYGDPAVAFPEDVRNGARIVSGWEAVPGQFPFQLSLRMITTVGGVVSCGGSIIHSNWGLTAAHCTANRVTIVVRAGAVNLTQPVYIFETVDRWNHPLYNEAMQGTVQPNDIGIIRFNREIIFNDYVQPIRMQRSADKDQNYQGIRLTASGWGVTWTQGTSPENLNWVYLLGTDNIACRQTFGAIIQDSTICARHYNVTSQSTCQGDSGGPLTVVDRDGKLSEVGVSSFVSGTGCHTDFPAGFIRPGHYHDWYYEVTGINFDWDFDEIDIDSDESKSVDSNGDNGNSDESDSEDSESSGDDDYLFADQEFDEFDVGSQNELAEAEKDFKKAIRRLWNSLFQ